MSTPGKHHFVPEVYLKEFSNSQKQLSHLKKGFSKITNKTIAQVCYKLDYFKLHSQDNLLLYKLNDYYHIEKNVFKKHENRYFKLLKRLTHPALTLVSVSKSEVILFIEILTTIKRRNPTYREQSISNYKNYVTSEKFKQDAEIGIELSMKLDTIDPIEYFENYIKEATTSENKQSDMYLRGFLDNENKIAQNVANTLLQYKLYMYHAPFGSEFITSDNPGFTLLQSGELISFGGLGLPFKFVFPLTPKHCLFINYEDEDLDNKFLLIKDIHIIHTDKKTVDTINTCTYRIAMQKVFAYSSNALKSLVM